MKSQNRRAAARSLLLAGYLAWLASAHGEPAVPEPSLRLHGAGATFPAPLYEQWIQAYGKQHPEVAIVYKAVGSGEGIKRFLANEVDFAGSDAAISDEEIAAVTRGVLMVPATIGMVVLAYNLPGLEAPLNLPRDVYVDILRGRIRQWNDTRVEAANPGARLPNRQIAIVARQDSSGTTYALTNHLGAISEEWRNRGPGIGKVVDWPGNAMVASGNAGVAARIKISEGSIGYVEYGIARRLGLTMARLQNKAGDFVAPSEEGAQQAFTENLGKMPENLRLFLPDPDGKASYPIVTFSWLLFYQKYSEPGRASALQSYASWALADGQIYSRLLGYVPLPPQVAVLAKAAVGAIKAR